MPFTKAKLTPGINRLSTRTEALGGYWDCNNIRFQYGKPESLFGWETLSSSIELNGFGRAMHMWTTIGGFTYLAVGTEQKFYVIFNNVAYDITPIESTGTPTDFTTVAPNLLTIDVSGSHDRAVGDWITTSDIAFTGVTLDGKAASQFINEDGEGWRVVAVNSPTSFTVELPFTVGADTDTLTAGTIHYQLSVSPYNISALGSGTGWGSGAWGSGPWGGGFAGVYSVRGSFRLWSIMNRGEDLVFSPTSGEIYIFSIADNVDPNTGVPDPDVNRRAVTLQSYALSHGGVVSVDVPQNNYRVITSINDGRLISFGCNQFSTDTTQAGDYSPMLVRWSDNDLNDKDIFDWGPRSTNTSGGQVLEKGSSIEAILQTTREKLVWTDVALYSMTNVSGSEIYAFSLIGENISIASPNAAVSVGDTVFFMGDSAFYMYRGTVELLPSTVDDYVFDDFNYGQSAKVHVTVNEKYSEVTWHYCSSDSMDINRYVTFNRSENAWYIGSYDSTRIDVANLTTSQLATKNRTSWLSPGILQSPIATYVKEFDQSISPVNVVSGIFRHEIDGYQADGQSMDAFVETGDFYIADLDQVIFVNKVIADFKYEGASYDVPGQGITLTFQSKRYPNTNDVAESIVEARPSAGMLNIRLRGKLFNVRISSSTQSYQWRLGDIYLDGRTDGKRP